jgi:hypothetical protein
MASKIKCPACGAKNDSANHRCRICTAVINPGAERAPAAEEPVVPAGIEHFDPGDIARQVRPARERFGSAGGALSARLAAAGEAATSRPPAGMPPPPPAAPAPPAAAPNPAGYEDEPFDPDALFRDMG